MLSRAKPVDMRKALVAVGEFKKAGILFVPMPVLTQKDGDSLCTEAFRRLDVLAQEAGRR